MPWFRVDDKLHDHRKTRKAKKSAMGVWVLAGSWCMDNLTDGFVPADVLPRWGTSADARALVNAGLWSDATRDGEKGYQFHDWTRFQPDARTILLTQEKESEAGQRGNHQRWHVKRKITDPDCEYCYRGPDQAPDRGPVGSPESGPESPPIRPRIARTQTHTQTTEPKGSGATQSLVAAWIEGCAERPPTRVVGQMSREIRQLVEDGINPETIQRGIEAWTAKRLHPSTLASVVHEQQGKVQTTASGEWFQPFRLPECPADIADDPERYEAWAEGKRQAWQAGERW